MLKISFLLFCLIGVVLAGAIGDYLRATRQCARSSRISLTVANKIARLELYPPDRKNQCFIRCLMERINLIDGEGNVTESYEATPLAKLPDAYQTLIIKWIDECRNADEGKSICQKTYNIYRCLAELKQKDYANVDFNESDDEKLIQKLVSAET